jgi:transposase
MATPLPLALRERLVEASEAPYRSLQTTADLFRVGTATLKRLRLRKRERGTLEPDPRRNGPPPKRTPARLAVLRELYEAVPDAFHHELAWSWTEALAPDGPRMTRQDVQRGLKELGFSRKKRR